MLVNDWQAIEDACAADDAERREQAVDLLLDATEGVAKIAAAVRKAADERETLERMRDAEFLTALRTAWANVKAAWLEDDSTQAFALIEMDLLLGVDESGHPLDAHGAKGNSRENAHWSDPEWLAILMEELGEVAHELTYDARDHADTREWLRKELVQVAAMACAWIAAIDQREVEPKPGTLEFDVQYP